MSALVYMLAREASPHPLIFDNVGCAIIQYATKTILGMTDWPERAANQQSICRT